MQELLKVKENLTKERDSKYDEIVKVGIPGCFCEIF